MRNCVAVGHLQPCVVLLVEPAAGADADAARAKAAILARTAPFNARLLEHERITDPAHIVIVPAGALPRTSVRACEALPRLLALTLCCRKRATSGLSVESVELCAR